MATYRKKPVVIDAWEWDETMRMVQLLRGAHPMTAEQLTTLVDRVRALDQAATSGPWTRKNTESRHRKGAPVCVSGEAILRVEMDTPEEAAKYPVYNGERELHVIDTGYVEDVLGPDGRHVVCLGGHDYDDCGNIEPNDAALIAEFRTLCPQLAEEARRLRDERDNLAAQNALLMAELPDSETGLMPPSKADLLAQITRLEGELATAQRQTDEAREIAERWFTIGSGGLVSYPVGINDDNDLEQHDGDEIESWRKEQA